MLKKTIEYKNYEGESRKGDFYFNLSRGELVRAEIRHATIKEGEEMQGGLRAKLLEITRSGDGGKIMDAFEDILRLSYGVRSEDGERFIKEPHVFTEFTQIPAYDVLFEELVTDADKAAAFINAIVPADISEQANADTPQRPYPTQATTPLPQAVREEVQAVSDANAEAAEVSEQVLTPEEEQILAKLKAKLAGN